ncbi:MAG: CBS domain-containing protein [Ignavibacteria bacterium]|nr:CBS domain-containing protein [Ignavibacteria bacterium]
MKKLPKVEEIMSKDLFVVSWNDTLRKALDLIRIEKIRHIPVVENGKYVGMIEEKRLNEYIRKKIYDPEEEIEDAEFSTISDFDYLVNRNVPILFIGDSILKALELFIKKKGDCFPVVDNDQNLIGVVSYIDLLLYTYKELSEKPK